MRCCLDVYRNWWRFHRDIRNAVRLVEDVDRRLRCHGVGELRGMRSWGSPLLQMGRPLTAHQPFTGTFEPRVVRKFGSSLNRVMRWTDQTRLQSMWKE